VVGIESITRKIARKPTLYAKFQRQSEEREATLCNHCEERRMRQPWFGARMVENRW